MFYSYSMAGMVDKVEWSSWPIGLNERFPVTVGDNVTLELRYKIDDNNGQTGEDITYSVKIDTSTCSLNWSCGPFKRSDPFIKFEGRFPNIVCTQMDFVNPWNPSQGNYEHSDQSIIILRLKDSENQSVGIIDSQGWLTTITNERLLATFTIKYSFMSLIDDTLFTPLITKIAMTD